jgi:hypothetical protein
MRKFKLIKKYPTIPEKMEVGDIVENNGKWGYVMQGTAFFFDANEVEGHDEYWQEITKGPTDPIVDSVIERFKSRSQEGIKKYGTTLDSNNSLSIIDWINHAQEEGMDRLLYLEKLKSEITKLVNKVTN